MATSKEDIKKAESIFEFTVQDIDGNDICLEKYRGYICLVVNTATNWGMTAKNFSYLRDLYAKYGGEKGLKILCFPCGQFMNQEPLDNPRIKEKIQKMYGEGLDLFSKINVNGGHAIPLFDFLKTKQAGTLWNFIKWNFTKFLCDKDGKPVKRYGPGHELKDIEKDIQNYLPGSDVTQKEEEKKDSEKDAETQ